MPHPPFDAEIKAGLADVQAHLTSSITPDLIDRLRAASAAGQTMSLDRIAVLADVTEVDANGVPLLFMTPKGTALNAVLPAVFFVHGGGMMAGTNRTGVNVVLDWMAKIPLVAVSVGYRLAPEHPHPAPVEDCYTGLCWLGEHLDRYAIDPDRLVVAGSSAGGGLAAATTLMVRDRGGPSLRGQLLLSPMLDDRARTPSSTELIGEGVWDSISNSTGWSALLGGSAGGDGICAYAAPARAVDLSGLPDAFVEVGSVETFRDESVDYASRIWQSGGQAELHVWPGACHGFESVAPQSPITLQARASRVDFLRRLFA